MKPVIVWVGQDGDGDCYVYNKKPMKMSNGWVPCESNEYVTHIKKNSLNKSDSLEKCIIISYEDYVNFLKMKDTLNEKYK